MASLTERLRAWTWHAQGLARDAESPGQALANVIGAYSSHPSAPLTLLARARFERTPFEGLDGDRRAVRLPGPRGSIFLLPVETAGRICAATAYPVAKFASRLEWAGLSLPVYEALKPRVLEALAEPLAAADLERRVPVPGVKVDVAARLMAHEGLVLRLAGSLRTDKLRYVATEAWIGAPLETPSMPESLAWLAAEYLRAFGPATIADFAWWAGVTRTAARAAIAAHETVDVGGGHLLPAASLAAWERTPPIPAAAISLLPKWDALTMGYARAGRARFIDAAHLALAYSRSGTGGAGATSGDGLPLVLYEGRAVATWGHTFAGDRMTVTVRPWEPRSVSLEALRPGLDEIGRLLGASSIDISLAS
ncbi:MAG: winged helix DNA-binding domain-containing protein [Dehalococcoidia bacterium]|nr:winged helix DNA-binding domain-containing protein [Dehalococcoidia bacterium]